MIEINLNGIYSLLKTPVVAFIVERRLRQREKMRKEAHKIIAEIKNCDIKSSLRQMGLI